MNNENFVVACAWCLRIKQSDGSYVKADIAEGSKVSHGICPWCDVKTRVSEYVPKLMQMVPETARNFVREQRDGFFGDFVVELTSKGFRLTFNKQEEVPPCWLELNDFHGVFFCTCHTEDQISPGIFRPSTHSGMAPYDGFLQTNTRAVYDNIVDMLLALPSET